MKILFFLFALLLSLVPAKNAFLDEKCSRLDGRCKASCQKNEELVAFCQKFLKCCVTLEPCGWNKTHDLLED
nr:beta-defensin 15-like [Jaculus jaculus]